MQIKYRKVIDVPVTPKGLREIADILELRYKKACIGDLVPDHVLTSYDHALEVRFFIDQEEMSRQEWMEKQRSK